VTLRSITVPDAGKDLSFERYKLDEELKIKREELELRKQELRKQRRLPEGIILAMVGLLGTLLGILLQGWNGVNLEQKKMQASLIIEAIKTGNPKDAIKNLEFLVRLKLIDDKDGYIAHLAREPESGPVLPGNPGRSSPLSIFSTDVDLLKFCQEKYGAQFFPLDADVLYCTDGKTKATVERSDVCQWAYGTDNFSMDFGSFAWSCDKASR
jgi:hypothetical protein